MMKTYRWLKLLSISLVVTGTFWSATPAWAANNKRPTTNASYDDSSPRHSCDSCRMGLGVTSIGPSGISNLLPGGFSVLAELSQSASIQGYLSIPSTSPFSFQVGGIYRSNIRGNQQAGLHWGGHLAFGSEATGISSPLTTSSSVFVVNFGPVLGAHFPISGIDRLGVSADATANFNVTDGNFNMSIGQLSPLLGLSIHYFL